MGNESSVEVKRQNQNAAVDGQHPGLRERNIKKDSRHSCQSPVSFRENIDFNEFFKKYSPYRILGVSESDSLEYILQKYRILLKTHHPDKGGDIKKFHIIKEAFAQINLLHEETQFSHTGAKQNFARHVSSQPDTVQDDQHNILHEKVSVAVAPDLQKQNRLVVDIQKQDQAFGPGMNSMPPKTSEGGGEFLEKFNRQFQDTRLVNENLEHGYGDLNWEQYDKREKKYEMISYEDIGYQSSGDIYAEPLENTFVENFSKYPIIGSKNLNYTDFLQAYTNDACILPDSHEKIWNQHFTTYHDRDLKKIKTQREMQPQMTPEEITRHRSRIEQENEINEARAAEWRDWVARQSTHYQSKQFIQ
jgi:curved DNA-binding protein CbpA